MKALIVEDSKINIEILQGWLTEEGIESAYITSSKMAVSKVKEYKPDIVLLDLVMPDMNGFQVCDALVSDRETRGTPILIMSSLEDMESKIKAIRSGGVDYLNKPFNKNKIILDIKRYAKIGEIMNLCRTVYAT